MKALDGAYVTVCRPRGAWLALAGCLAATACDDPGVRVGNDEFLVVIATQGADLPPGRVLAGPGEKGVRADVLGPGRHRLRAGERYERHPMVHVPAGRVPALVDGKPVPGAPPSVGVVTALTGEPLPDGEFLAGPGQRGLQREVLTPGTYLLNPYAHRVELHPAIVIPPGRVGVVTHLAGALTGEEFAGADERGVQREVLHAGTYFLNPYEYQVTPVRVGYRELTFAGKQAIQFPASDSNTVTAEVSIIWGVLPEDAPYLVKRFGSEADIVDRVIQPQVESIVRLLGSDYGSHEFVEGDSRARFQQEVTERLKTALEAKNLRVLLALVRHLDVPESVRKPLQLARLAEEQGLTNAELLETSKSQTELHEAQAAVAVAAARERAETERLYALELAEGQAAAARLAAESAVQWNERARAILATKQETAALIAAAEAEAARAKGEAQADALARLLEALGSERALALWTLAEHLGPDLRIELAPREARAPAASP